MREDDQSGGGDGGAGGLTAAYALGVARRFWRPVAAMVVVSTLLAIGVALSLPNRFEGVSTVQIDPRRKNIANVDGVISDLKADQTTVESEVEVIRSKTVTLKVIELLDLRSDPEFTQPSLLSRWMAQAKELLTGSSLSQSVPAITQLLADAAQAGLEPARDEIVVAFAERLKVSRVRTTTLIEIRFSSSSAVKAARVANAIAEVYIKDQVDEKFRASNLAASLLEEKLAEMRSRVAEAERRVEQFKAEHKIFDTEGQILSERQLSRLMEQSVLAGNAKAEAKAKYDQARRVIARGGSKAEIPEVLQSQTIRQLKDELARLTRREAELDTRYGDKHPEMLKVRAEITDASRQLDIQIDRLVANLKNEYEAAEDRENQLAASLEAAKEQQIDTKDAAVKLKELQRDAATSKHLFEALLTRFKQTSETQDFHLPDARIVERAGVPLKPAAPKRKVIVFAAFVGSLGFALSLVFLLDFLTPGVARGEDIPRVLEHEHLASLPVVEGSQEQLRAARLMVADPHGVFAEAIRGLRHELDSVVEHHTPRVVLIASALPNEGKSAVASNLAHHLALTGVRTLLVDADLRKGSLTTVLCAGGATLGARDCLEDRLPVEQAILRDQTTGLCFLPAYGPQAARTNASELLVSPAMTGMIGRLREHFDAIIVDCPPVMPVVDARILADFADQIVFVMSWRKTPKDLARKALRSLGANERKVVGVVLNQVADAEVFEPSVYGERPAVPVEPRLDAAA